MPLRGNFVIEFAWEFFCSFYLFELWQGKKCTAYPAVKINVVLGGGFWLDPEPIERCFTDGNLVTGAAWPGHPEFISQFMNLLGINVSF